MVTQGGNQKRQSAPNTVDSRTLRFVISRISVLRIVDLPRRGGVFNPSAFCQPFLYIQTHATNNESIRLFLCLFTYCNHGSKDLHVGIYLSLHCDSFIG